MSDTQEVRIEQPEKVALETMIRGHPTGYPPNLAPFRKWDVFDILDATVVEINDEPLVASDYCQLSKNIENIGTDPVDVPAKVGCVDDDDRTHAASTNPR
jgi:hypothetical protein